MISYEPAKTRKGPVFRRNVVFSVLEYGYYVTILYALVGPAWGIEVPLLGAGAMVVLAIACVMHLSIQSLTVHKCFVYQIACGLSFIGVQAVFHGDLASSRPFVTWLLGLIIVQSLSLRERFLHRFAIVAFIIGIMLLPYLDYYVDSSDLSRLGLKGVGLGNPNSLAMWFGFSSVYFLVAGIQSKTNLCRAIWWVLSLGSLYAVAITVSRGPLLAAAIAGVIALRKLTKRGFVPVLFLLIVFWAGLMSGIFDKVVGFYMERGGEDSGRWFLWTEAIDKFFTSPWVGVGTSATGAALGGKYMANPHNGLLYIGVSSGVIPLYFFIAYWLRSGRSALKANSQGFPDAAFHLPLFVFAFLEMLQLDTVFMSAWHMVVLAILMPAGFSRRVRKVMTQEPFREGRSVSRAPSFGRYPSRPWQTSAKWYSRT